MYLTVQHPSSLSPTFITRVRYIGQLCNLIKPVRFVAEKILIKTMATGSAFCHWSHNNHFQNPQKGTLLWIMNLRNCHLIWNVGNMDHIYKSDSLVSHMGDSSVSCLDDSLIFICIFRQYHVWVILKCYVCVSPLFCLLPWSSLVFSLSPAGMQHLNGIKMFGKQLRVAPSKHLQVQMPKEGQPVSTDICLGVWPQRVRCWDGHGMSSSF